MKHALVTGGSGFLGSHIADALTARGVRVTIFDCRPSPFVRPGQSMMLGDVLDCDAVARAMRGVDHVFHLAAFADLNHACTEPIESARLNLIGTLNCLTAAQAAGVQRFMFASTVYVYSRDGGFYRCSKQACESYIEEFQRQYGLDYTILRYGSLYGPRADDNNGVFRLLKQAMLTGCIRHDGNRDDVREYIHVEDAARLSADAADDAYTNEHLVITGHHPTRIQDLFIMFGEILGRELNVVYVDDGLRTRSGHYRITPYAYSPKPGRKLTSNHYVDMGQGVLQLLDELQAEDEMIRGNARAAS